MAREGALEVACSPALHIEMMSEVRWLHLHQCVCLWRKGSRKYGFEFIETLLSIYMAYGRPALYRTALSP